MGEVGVGGGKLCAWKSVCNYLEINKRRSDNECVKSQPQAEWSVAELEASINAWLCAASSRLALPNFQLVFAKRNKGEEEKKCSAHRVKR